MDRRTFTYRIDADGVISFVSPEWLAFARENDTPQLANPGVVGKPLEPFIADMETQHLYRVILSKVRTDREVICLPFRCDAPHLRRYMEMVLRPWGAKGVEFNCRVVRDEPRPPVPLFTSTAAHSDRSITMCSWCKKIATPKWREVEEAIEQMHLFELSHMPQISHSVCDQCHRQIQLASLQRIGSVNSPT